MARDRTTITGRRLGYNETHKMDVRRENRKKFAASFFHWMRRRGWIVLLIVALLGVAVWQGWFYIRKINPMELRTLKSIEISGNRMLTWEDIIQASGLQVGVPLSEINEDSVKARIEKMPLLRSADVHVNLLWSVQIDVQETSPVMVRLHQGKWQVLSERGLVLPMPTSAAYQLPVVSADAPWEIGKVGAFLLAMKTWDDSLYREVSQASYSMKDHAVEVFFRDVDFKTLFPEEAKSAELFEHYRMLVYGKTQALSGVTVLDMRFNGFAYTEESSSASESVARLETNGREESESN